MWLRTWRSKKSARRSFRNSSSKAMDPMTAPLSPDNSKWGESKAQKGGSQTIREYEFVAILGLFLQGGLETPFVKQFCDVRWWSMNGRSESNIRQTSSRSCTYRIPPVLFSPKENTGLINIFHQRSSQNTPWPFPCFFPVQTCRVQRFSMRTPQQGLKLI
jgi:hypothetical protein